MGRLTTHVLDTAHGIPAAGMALALMRVTAAGVEPVLTAHTNADGRCNSPLLAEGDFQTGTYQIHFQVAAYYRAKGFTLAEPPFLDVVILSFGLSTDQHYHVPLLVTPFGYSTYRGS